MSDEKKRGFRPFVPADSTEPEMSWKALTLGLLLSALFGAANAYLAMKAGQTIAATIPAAVIAIAAFRLPFFRGGVLEQNIARTAASVGEALVAGAAFTIPAFLLAQIGGQAIWSDFRGHFWDAVMMLLAGGLLGVFFIIGSFTGRSVRKSFKFDQNPCESSRLTTNDGMRTPGALDVFLEGSAFRLRVGSTDFTLPRLSVSPMRG